ncbi:MAG TPA: hypothetical protein VLW52_16530 [Opitutaceae bacterium]|nr:hypothetical protein [Opitutaceae bacterium]
MNNADLAQSPLAANLEILIEQAGDIRGREGVKIQLVGDGNADGRRFFGHIKGHVPFAVILAA